MLLLESTLHDQLVTTVDSPASSQLGEQEREQMFRGSVQHLSNLSEVSKSSFLGTNPHNLGKNNLFYQY